LFGSKPQDNPCQSDAGRSTITGGVKHNDEVQLCAFDILAEGGDDLRKLPLSMHGQP